eukprot:COSAG06_NODE_22176_length_731_cov_1.764241_1_plen_67_part_00
MHLPAQLFFGTVSLLSVITMHVLRLVGFGYSNPEGKLNVIFPGKNGPLKPFMHKNDHFTQTGSGQT